MAALAATALIAPASASAINPVSFSRVGNMTVPRDGPGAALLPDGRVLVVGGCSTGALSSCMDTAEVFDPKTNTFSALGATMNDRRFGPSVATLPDGRVLIAGGQDGSGDVTSAEVFNPGAGSFTAVGSMGVARELAGAAPLPDGRVLIAGGFSNGPSVDSTEIFDPGTNTFSAGPTLPYPVGGAGTAVISGGRILLAAGQIQPGNTDLDSAIVFNPPNGPFSAAGSLPGRAYAPAGAPLPGGRALIAGGYDPDAHEETSRALVFDPATNSFSSAGIGNLIVKREEAAAAELKDGRVLVVGGFSSDSIDTAEVLSVPSNAFKAKLKGRKIIFKVTNEGVASAADTSAKFATTAKKKKLVKTTSKHGGPGKIKVKVKLTRAGSAKLAEKGKLTIKAIYTPDGGLAAVKKLKLRAGK